MDFKRHELVWTDEKTQRFWDWMSNESAYEDQYFSMRFGGAIVSYALQRGGLRRSDAILDFGCGPGYLLERLSRSGMHCSGVEFSSRTIERAVQRLSNCSSFGGVTRVEGFPVPLASESYDFVFLIETVEHLSSEGFEGTIKEIHRLLKKGGRVMITTPYRESLKASSVLCPDCGAIFHRMQHLRSWSEDALKAEMEREGFRTVTCEGTSLLNPGLEGHFIRLLRNVRSLIWRASRKDEQLIYIGEK